MPQAPMQMPNKPVGMMLPPMPVQMHDPHGHGGMEPKYVLNTKEFNTSKQQLLTTQLQPLEPVYATRSRHARPRSWS
jgi:hypothetical protein